MLDILAQESTILTSLYNETWNTFLWPFTSYKKRTAAWRRNYSASIHESTCHCFNLMQFHHDQVTNSWDILVARTSRPGNTERGKEDAIHRYSWAISIPERCEEMDMCHCCRPATMNETHQNILPIISFDACALDATSIKGNRNFNDDSILSFRSKEAKIFYWWNQFAVSDFYTLESYFGIDSQRLSTSFVCILEK